MTRRRLVIAAVLAVAVVWHKQSALIGVGTRWYLASVAAREGDAGDLTQRRQAIAHLNRMLLLEQPRDPLVPELFDLLTALSSRVATGEINLNWAAYVYTSYQRDLIRDRPDGQPRRTSADIETAVAEYVRFYSLQQRPDEAGFGLGSLTGGVPDESYTVEEIEQAAREGRDLTRP